MKSFFYCLFSKISKLLLSERIIGKPFLNENTKLYYEISQHLTFLFQKKIRYEDYLQKKINSLINKGDIIFDIGGNIGQYALLFSELVGNEGKVYSFEPDYKNFSFLQFNKNINKKENLICLNYGLGAKEGILEFYRDTETGGRMGSFKKEFVKNRYRGLSEQVEINKFDKLIYQYGIPDFVKIDVEGFEYEVLSGLSKILKETIFFIEVRKETKTKVFEYFNKDYFNCYSIDSNNKLINDAKEILDFANLIFIPKSKVVLLK